MKLGVVGNEVKQEAPQTLRAVLELRPGMPGIFPALVTLVPGTATAEAIPAGDTVYPRLCEIVSDNYGKSY